MHTETLQLSILLFREHGKWAGQCLEYDVTAQGHTVEDASYEVHRMIAAEFLIRGELQLDMSDIPPAPDVYHKMWRSALRVEDGPCRFQSMQPFEPKMRLAA